jgi:hypothetical protein
MTFLLEIRPNDLLIAPPGKRAAERDKSGGFCPATGLGTRSTFVAEAPRAFSGKKHALAKASPRFSAITSP